MKGIFCFEDVHATVDVPVRSGVILLPLHISVLAHESPDWHGVVITPEHPKQRPEHFVAFAGHFVPPKRREDFLCLDVCDRELLWRPPESGELAIGIRQCLASGWNGDSLLTLRDDYVRGMLATVLGELAEALTVPNFYRTDGTPILGVPHLL